MRSKTAKKSPSTFAAIASSPRNTALSPLKPNSSIASHLPSRRIFDMTKLPVRRLQPKGLTEISRWSELAETPGKTRFRLHPEGVPDMCKLFLAAVITIALHAVAFAATVPLKCINPDPDKSMSDAVVVEDSDLVHTAQILPSATKEDARKQADEVLSKLETILKPLGASLQQACKLNVSLASDGSIKPVQQALAARFSGPVQPAVA